MAIWKPENSMLTLTGIEILNKVKAGIGKITVTRVVAGSGRVPASQLNYQTSISGSNKTMSINHSTAGDMGSEISVYISNENFTESFDLNQIGVFVTHPDYNEEQLYHISQCEAEGADVIPSLGDTPVTFGYSLFLEHGNANSFNITVDLQGMVSIPRFEELESSLVNPNLLDNWFFVNPVILGSFGKSPISRWTCPEGAIQLVEAGIHIKQEGSPYGYGLFQTLITNSIYSLGHQVTISVLTTEGLFSKTGLITDNVSTALHTVYSTSTSHFRIYYSGAGLVGEFVAIGNNDPAVIAVKVELGSKQTLAHQDSKGDWVLNEVPNFAEESAKCSQYDPATGAYSGPNLIHRDAVIKSVNNGYGTVFKNHSATNDFGFEISDVDKDNNCASIILVASQDPKDGHALLFRYNGELYKLYGEHNKHLISEVIQATVE